MKKLTTALAIAALISGLFTTGSTLADTVGKNPRGCEVTKSLFVNITTGRIQKTTVAFLVSDANLEALGADVTLFLADEAAILAVDQVYWPSDVLDDQGRFNALTCLQGTAGDGITCPPTPTLKSLRDKGVEALGCPLCVQEVISDSGLSIFDSAGRFLPDVWNQVVFDEIQWIAPGDFALIYDRRTRNPRCTINAAVMSF